MKQQLHKYIPALLMLVIVSFSSCKKSFLEVDYSQQLYRQTYVKDLSTMSDYMNGVYITLSTRFSQGTGSAYPELVADNLKPLTGVTTPSMLTMYSWAQTASQSSESTVGNASVSMNGMWKAVYGTIRNASFVIEDVDKYRDENPAKADNIKGQALVLRALMHFKLVNIFAQSYNFSANGSHPGIPYITTPDVTKHFSRQSVAEVYQAMISDIENAIALLPATVTDTRYMNKIAAQALLARIYLFKEDYANAKTLATTICNQFPLLTIANGYPNGLFTEKKPEQSEILFRLTPQSLPYFGVTSSFLGSRFRGTTRVFVASNDIASILQENANDARRTWVTPNGIVWDVTKYPESSTPELNLPTTNFGLHYYPPVLRSSEMFLTVAEAAAKTNDENTARTYLDAIRKRANPSIASVTATGTALLDSIYKERRKELAFEELRMYDLLRWKKGVNRIDVYPGAPANLPYPSNKAISPMPLMDVQIEGIPQNTGY